MCRRKEQEYEHIQITEDNLLSRRVGTQQAVVSARLAAIYLSRTQTRGPNLAKATARGSLTMLKSASLTPSESFTHGWFCDITDRSSGNTASLNYAAVPNEDTPRSTFHRQKKSYSFYHHGLIGRV